MCFLWIISSSSLSLSPNNQSLYHRKSQSQIKGLSIKIYIIFLVLYNLAFWVSFSICRYNFLISYRFMIIIQFWVIVLDNNTYVTLVQLLLHLYLLIKSISVAVSTMASSVSSGTCANLLFWRFKISREFKFSKDIVGNVLMLPKTHFNAKHYNGIG